MKKITGFLFIAIVAISCTKFNTDLKIYNIKGKVWKIQETSFEGEQMYGKYHVGDYNYYTHTLNVFNEYGNLVESHILNRKGNSADISKYLYNEDNICTEISTHSHDKLKSKKIINVIEGNKITEAKVYDTDGKIENIYQYEYSGNDIVGRRVYNKDKKITATFENKFRNGLIEEQTVKNSTNEVISICKYIRNSNGDVAEQITTYPKDNTEIKYSFKYEYDKKNNWKKKHKFNKAGNIEDIIVRNIIYFGESKVSKNENDYIGMWLAVGDDNDCDWIELKKDKKYNSGDYEAHITESGNWEIDTNEQLLTFKANNPDDSRKYKYDFEGYRMVLYTMQGDEIVKLEKR